MYYTAFFTASYDFFWLLKALATWVSPAHIATLCDNILSDFAHLVARKRLSVAFYSIYLKMCLISEK